MCVHNQQGPPTYADSRQLISKGFCAEEEQRVWGLWESFTRKKEGSYLKRNEVCFFKRNCEREIWVSGMVHGSFFFFFIYGFYGVELAPLVFLPLHRITTEIVLTSHHTLIDYSICYCAPLIHTTGSRQHWNTYTIEQMRAPLMNGRCDGRGSSCATVRAALWSVESS